MRREKKKTIDGLHGNGLQMAAGAFGHAKNYGWDLFPDKGRFNKMPLFVPCSVQWRYSWLDMPSPTCTSCYSATGQRCKCRDHRGWESGIDQAVKGKKSEIWNKCVSKQEKRRQRLTHFFFPFSASCVCTKALWNFGVCVLRASERWEPWLTGIFKKVRRTRRRHFRFQKWRGKCLWSHISATEEDYVICFLGYLVYFKDMYLGIKEEKNPNQNNVGTDPHELHEVLWKRMPRGTMSSR